MADQAGFSGVITRGAIYTVNYRFLALSNLKLLYFYTNNRKTRAMKISVRPGRQRKEEV